MSPIPALFFALIWMWSDSIGALLSVISTYFYFGWEGTPLLVPKIFGLALFAFSGPVFYRILFHWVNPTKFVRFGVGLLFVLYVSLSLNRSSDFFAWGTLLACWWAGITLMGILRHLRDFSKHLLALYALQLAFFFYLSTRTVQAGLPLMLLAPQGMGYIPWSILSLSVLLGAGLPYRMNDLSNPLETRSLKKGSGSIGLVFGLLMGMSVGIIQNLHIWSARTPDLPSAAYFLSLGLGVFLGRALYLTGTFLPIRLGVSGVALAAGIYGLLYFDINTVDSVMFQRSLSLIFHGAGALGLTTFWCFFLQRFSAYQRQQKTFFPWLSLQTGFIGLLLVLAIFLLKANPIGFWVAWGLSLSILFLHELRAGESIKGIGKPHQRLWYGACGVFALLGLTSFFAPQPGSTKGQAENSAAPFNNTIEVMSTNIRYGWTDDYRFAPLEHMRYLKQRIPDILGVQEVNKGHTSGAYSDLYRLYQQALPGQWSYADANFGFGNAMLSRYPVLHSEGRVYQAKDMLKRSCLINTLKIGENKVTVLVTHVSHLAAPNPVRQAQINELSGWIQQLDTPWILIGDFNATPDTAEIQQLIQLSHPVYQSQPPWLNSLSFPAAQPDRRIDYIFFSKDFELQTMEVLNNGTTTDHRPVRAELRL